MPRTYKADPKGKKYKKYDVDHIAKAIQAYRSSNKSLKFIADEFKMDKSVLYRHATRTMKRQGGQTVLSEETEKTIVKYINISANWGYPLDTLDLRFLVKHYLDKVGRTVSRFKNNLPGVDFVRNFLKRHKDQISRRNSQNIKNNRAGVSPTSIKKYFEELKLSLANVKTENIITYDETNLTDDPGGKKVISKRDTKYPEATKSNAPISIMMAANAEGQLLPPYVVYKAQNLYVTWRENGPSGTRYNRSQSGWFDGYIFEDWVKTIILPYFKKKQGKKVLIGDSLSSHLSLDVIKICHEQDISFIFLPAKSTHLTQPLHVALFRPMKLAWRTILLEWKKTVGKSKTSLPKSSFPKLLKKLMEDLYKNSEENIISGFRKAGIKPFDANQVLNRLSEKIDKIGQGENEAEKSVLDLLKETRSGTIDIKAPKRKRKSDVTPGGSVCLTKDVENIEIELDIVKRSAKRRRKQMQTAKDEVLCDQEISYVDEEDKIVFQDLDSKRELKIEKCKGKGKKSKGTKGKEKTDSLQNGEIYSLSKEDLGTLSISIGDYIFYDGNEIVIVEI